MSLSRLSALAGAALLLCSLIVHSETVYVDEPPARLPSGPELKAMVTDIRRLSNEARQSNSVGTLNAGSHLDQAAQGHSQEMLDLGFFGHYSPTPGRKAPMDRIRLAGGIELTNAENVYKCAGYEPEEVAALSVKAFLRSPTHRKNLLNNKYNSIGIGVAYKDNAYTVTQVFAYTTIQVETLKVEDLGGNYRVTIKAKVIEGPTQGAFFAGSSKIQGWEADSSGVLEASFETGEGLIAIGQKSGNRYSIEGEFPVPQPR